MEIGFKKIVCNLLGITARSYSNWAKELRPIITFFEKGYLNKNELKEFLDTGKIKKLDLIKKYSFEELQEKLTNQQNIVNNEELMIKNLIFKFLIFNKEAPLLILRNILKELKQTILEKNDLIGLIRNYQSNLIKNLIKIKKNTIFFIDKLLTDEEVKLLIKYKNEILLSFANIEDIEIN